MKRITALLAVLTIAALACNLLPSSVDDLAATAESAISDLDLPDELDEPSPPPSPEQDSSGNGVGGPESLNLDEPLTYSEPVDQIGSYRIELNFAFEGTADGAPVRGSVVGSGERTLDPLAMSMRFEAFDNAAQTPELPLAFSLMESAYTVSSPSMGCATIPAGELQDPFTLLLDLGGFLTGEAPRLRPDQEVNGMPVYRFAIDDSNVVPDELDVAEVTDGTIYIAQDGGYVVRLEINGTGTSEELSGEPGLVGQISYSLDYYDFNQPLQIEPPEGCTQAAADLEYPVTDDAYQLSVLPGIVSYRTNISLDEVIQFYKAEMAAAGWTLTDEFAAGPAALLSFSGEAGSVQVTLAADEANGTVEVGIIGGG